MAPLPDGGPFPQDLDGFRVIVGELFEQVVLDPLVDRAQRALAHAPEDRPLRLVVVDRAHAAIRLIRAIYTVRLRVEVRGDRERLPKR